MLIKNINYISNINYIAIMNNLFRAVKKLSFYIYNNKLDRVDYWERIKKIIPDKPFCNMSWNIDIFTNDGKKICCLSAVYEYVINTFKIKPTNDEMIENYLSDEKFNDECGFFFLELVNIQHKYPCTLLRMCQIAYNLGQYQALYNNNSFNRFFTDEINKYYTTNKLNYFYSYVNFDDCNNEDDKQLFSNKISEINNLYPKQKGGNYHKKYIKYKKKYILLKKIYF
jgi:hypothetical protein